MEVSLAERTARIHELDLEPIKFKLLHPKDGVGWTLEQADAAEVLYKQYLTLNLKYPDQANVPNEVIDTFWHYHILDTRAYAADCDFALGQFLHHFPYLGLRGAEDEAVLTAAWEKTVTLFREEFGTDLELMGADCTDCAPVPSCSGEPSPSVVAVRPRPVRQAA